MGLRAYCKKTRHGLDLSASGFRRLRIQISDLCGQPWARHYRALVLAENIRDKDDAWFRDYDAETYRLIGDKTIHPKVVNFLMQSDLLGYIRYGACAKILDVIRNSDCQTCIGYPGRPDQPTFQDFKALLQECVDNKCDLRWSD